MRISGFAWIGSVAFALAETIACTPFDDQPALGTDATVDGAHESMGTATNDAPSPAASEKMPERTADAGCERAQPPPPPGIADAGGALDLVFAVRMSTTGIPGPSDAGPGYESIGFNLDGTCVGGEGAPRCVLSSSAPRSFQETPGGIDNGLGHALAYLESFPGVSVPSNVPPTPDSVRTLIRVRAYSGQKDDDQVEVSEYLAQGLEPREDGGIGPNWDGQDRWMVLQQSLVPPDGSAPFDLDQPLATDHAAYVTDWNLVAHFERAQATTGLPPSPAALYPIWGVVFSGQLVQPDAAGGPWALADAMSGFRIAMSDLLTLFAQGPLPDGGGSVLCSKADQYNFVKGSLCGFVDTSLPLDAAAGRPCNAISQGTFAQFGQGQFADATVPSPDSAPLPCAPDVAPPTNGCLDAGP